MVGRVFAQNGVVITPVSADPAIGAYHRKAQ